MPNSHDLSNSEGLVKTYDLLTSLISDVQYSFEILHNDENLQSSRRNVVRSTFSFIEGVIQILKFELKADFRLGKTDKALTKKETEILYDVKTIENRKIPWNVPLDVNLKKTILIAAKTWCSKKDIFEFSSDSYNSFLRAKSTRNRLTHPRTYYDIQISEEEIKQMAITFKWMKELFVSIIEEKIKVILETLPNEVVNAYKIQQLKEYCC